MRIDRRHLSLLGLAAVILVVAAASRRHPAQAPIRGPAAVAQTRAEPDDTQGEARTYALDWTALSEGEVAPAGEGKPAQLMKVETALRAEVLVEPREPNGRRDSLQLVAFSLRSLERFSARVMGQEGVPDLTAAAKELVGPVAIVAFDARGKVDGLSYDETSSPASRQLLRALVQLFQLSRTEGEVSESGTAGALTVRYTRDGAMLLRKPLVYTRLDAVPGALDGQQQLSGETRIELGARRQLESARGTEQLAYARPGQQKASLTSEMAFTLQRIANEPATVRNLSMLATNAFQPLEAMPRDPGLAGRRDLRMAAFLNDDAFSLEIDRYASGAKLDHAFMARAGAYLRVHPAAAKALVVRFQLPATGIKARGLILDLLTEAGDPNAQEAMRAALASPAAVGAPGEHGLFLQRFSFVRAPTSESARFLEATMAAGGATLQAQQGATVALGAMIGHLAKTGHEELAATYNRELVQRLSEAKDTDHQRALLTALGNAGRPENVKTLLGYVASAEPTVREQAASALRGVDSEEARSALIGLSGDQQSGVALLAMRSLSRQKLSGGDWDKLQEQVAGKQLNAAVDVTLVELIRSQRAAAGTAGEKILRALLAPNGGGENDLGGIIEGVLAGR